MPVCPTNPTRPDSRGNTKTIPTTERRARHLSAATNHLRGPAPPPLTRPASLSPLPSRATSLWGVWGPPIPRYLRLTDRSRCVCVCACVRACVRLADEFIYLFVFNAPRPKRRAGLSVERHREQQRWAWCVVVWRGLLLGVMSRRGKRRGGRRSRCAEGFDRQKVMARQRSRKAKSPPLPPTLRAVVRARAVRTAAPRATDFAIELLSRAAEPTMMDG